MGNHRQAGQRGNHTDHTGRHWRPRLGSDELEGGHEGQGIDGQISELSDHGASQPVLPGPSGSGLSQGDSDSGEVRRRDRTLSTVYHGTTEGTERHFVAQYEKP